MHRDDQACRDHHDPTCRQTMSVKLRWPWARGLALMIVIPIAGAGASWTAFVHVMSWSWSPAAIPAGFLIAVIVMAMAMTMIEKPLHGFLLLLGWFLVGLYPVAPFWNECFQTTRLAHLGSLALLASSILLALPAFIAPRRAPASGVIVALVLGCLPIPLGLIGMSSPLLAAGALFPGMGWVALAMTLVFLGLSAVRRKPMLRYARIAQILILNLGLYQVMAWQSPSAPSLAWGATSFNGEAPALMLNPYYDYEDQFKAQAIQAVSQGARLVLMPEGVDPHWTSSQAFYWSNVAIEASRLHAQVLLGVYRTRPGSRLDRQDGLVDLVTGAFYPARMTVPVSMWRPWARAHIGSFVMTLADAPIPTRYGNAAYLICYEETLIWPLAWQDIHFEPKLLLSASNQWFARGGLGRIQKRSVVMQARLWGLPLVRAVNHPIPLDQSLSEAHP